MISNLILVALVLIFVFISSNVMEHAAGSPGTLVQLATSSTEYPNGYEYGYYGNPYSGYGYGNTYPYHRNRYPRQVEYVDIERNRGYSQNLNEAYVPILFFIICLFIFVLYQQRQ